MPFRPGPDDDRSLMFDVNVEVVYNLLIKTAGHGNSFQSKLYKKYIDIEDEPFWDYCIELEDNYDNYYYSVLKGDEKANPMTFQNWFMTKKTDDHTRPNYWTNGYKELLDHIRELSSEDN